VSRLLRRAGDANDAPGPEMGPVITSHDVVPLMAAECQDEGLAVVGDDEDGPYVALANIAIDALVHLAADDPRPSKGVARVAERVLSEGDHAARLLVEFGCVGVLANPVFWPADVRAGDLTAHLGPLALETSWGRALALAAHGDGVPAGAISSRQRRTAPDGSSAAFGDVGNGPVVSGGHHSLTTAGRMRWEWAHLPDERHCAEARRSSVAALRKAGMGDEVLDAVETVVGELTANAVRHAGPTSRSPPSSSPTACASRWATPTRGRQLCSRLTLSRQPAAVCAPWPRSLPVGDGTPPSATAPRASWYGPSSPWTRAAMSPARARATSSLVPGQVTSERCRRSVSPERRGGTGPQLRPGPAFDHVAEQGREVLCGHGQGEQEPCRIEQPAA